MENEFLVLLLQVVKLFLKA